MAERPLLLHVQDADITLYASAADRVSSPGIAHMGKHGLKIGLEAKDLARRHPKSLHNQFWRAIRQQPLSGEDRIERTEAELVYEHLQSLTAALKPSGNQVVLAVPGHHDREALALLLGIVDACGLEPVGLVHAGLLQIAHLPPQNQSAFLEMHLGHATLSEIGQSENNHHTVGSSQSFDALGLDDLLKHWVEGLSEEFIHQTRYNPLHSPEGEQQLYDLLWRIKGLERPESLALQSGEQTYEIQLGPHEWGKVSDAFLNTLKTQLSDNQKLILGPRLSNMAFIAEALHNDFDTQTVNTESLWDNFENCWPKTALGRDNLILTRELGAISTPSPRADVPTHLLIGTVAWALDKEIYIANIDGALGRQSTQMHGARLFQNGAFTFIDPAQNTGFKINGKTITTVTKLGIGCELSLEGCDGNALVICEGSYDT